MAAILCSCLLLPEPALAKLSTTSTMADHVQPAHPTQPAHPLPSSLPAEVNTATRSLHTALNRLITSRLPLALPPHSRDSSLYAAGLLHFAHIFLTFESLWSDLLRHHAHHDQSSPSAQAPSGPPASYSDTASPPMSPLLSYLLVNPYDSPSFFTATLGAPTRPSHQLASFLQTLRPKGLIRSSRLKRDLEHLLGLHPTDLEVLLANYPGDKVAEFCTHIRKSVNEKPWTLVSYAWCFYMAIFSGGRWIRGQLHNAPADFWPTSGLNDASRLQERGLSFWHFAGPHDGEDIKAEFKLQLTAADHIFSPDERVDIIEEAKTIFKFCATLVDELDTIMATSLLTAELVAPSQSHSSAPDEKQAPHQIQVEVSTRSVPKFRSRDAMSLLLHRPEVTGTLMALGCLVCVALLKLQE